MYIISESNIELLLLLLLLLSFKTNVRIIKQVSENHTEN